MIGDADNTEQVGTATLWIVFADVAPLEVLPVVV